MRGEGESGLGGFDPLARLRGFRVRRDRGRGIGEDCGRLMRSLERVSGDQAAVVSAWEVVVPDDLKGVGWVIGLRGGRLEIGVENAGGRYRVDRWLRTGGLDAVRLIGKVRVKSVVLKICERAEPEGS